MVRRTRVSLRACSLFFSIVVVLSMLLAACGSDNDEGGDMAAMDEDSEVAQAASAPTEAMASTSEFAGSVEESESEPAAGQFALDRLVIRTAQITISVDDTLGATGSVRNLATTKGGFVFSSTTYTENDQEYAQLTLRVPAERFDETIADLRSAPYVTDVEREESSSQDVSAEFVDNESRLTALEETQRRYLSLLSEADTVDELLRLETELTDVRSQIETIKGRQNYLSEMTSFSTITVTLRPDNVEEDPDDGMAVTRIFDSAWERSIGALAGLAEAVIVIAIFAAFFVPLSIGVYALYKAARRVTTRIAE